MSMENLAKNQSRGDHDKTMMNHGIDVKELELSSIHSNGLEIASYGLSVPKTVNKRQNKAKDMTKDKSRSNAQVSEPTKNVQPLESAIDSKVVVEKQTEVKKMVKKTRQAKKDIAFKEDTEKLVIERKAKKSKTVKANVVHRKQRKGKSLLTAFMINKMGRRTVLNLNRGEIGHKYA